MRCRVCEATYEPTVDGQADLQLVAEWDHRVARLVATVGVAFGRARSADHQARARAFLLGRGWFTAEVDGVVGWASEMSEDATPAIVDELVVALEMLRTVIRPSGMQLIVAGLGEIVRSDDPLDLDTEELLARCADAAGVDLASLVEDDPAEDDDDREAVAA